MKKALSVLLAVLMLFSMFSMAASAAEDNNNGYKLVKVTFINEGKEYKVYDVWSDESPEALSLFATQISGLANPTKASTETTEYIFDGWKNTENNQVYYVNEGLPMPDADITYVATYAEKDIVANQSFWAFVQSIFARINMIFEYFAKVFEGIIDFD
ncbi:MAG: hypothetical protein IKV21_01835 [Clostridia bacterium]|nr:hypothetical protein [Clostridia bacterium]